MENLSNRTIKGYELRERIGAGGFGAVYRAYQPSVGREVAIKVILPQHANHPDFIRRFEFEAQLVARLEHPHIVPLYDYWRDPDGAFLVMRWLNGSLRSAIQRGSWSVESSARLLDQIAGALTVAHRDGIVHRDIKPDNILLDEDENAYLADFGIAKDLAAGTTTEEGALVGSPAYITPEQIKGEPITSRADIYSLGLVMYEILVNEKPYPGATTPYELINKHLNEPLPSINTRRSNLPAALNEVLQTATAKDPSHRYANVLRFASAFRAILPSIQRGPAQPLPEPLTERELDILHLMVEGLDNTAIAERLVISLATVRWYVKQIYVKLDVHSRHQAIQRAQQLNLNSKSQPTVDLNNNGHSGSVSATSQSILMPELVNPYKGLRAFQETDAEDFFGRAALTEQLLARLAESGDGARFLVVVGPSGSGKSSVVKAGLIPALRRGGLPASDHWFVTEMLPGTHPLEELEAALLRIAVAPMPGLLDQLLEDRRGLVRIAKRLLPGDQDTELLLVIDQFEELFTLVDDEKTRAHFIDNLLSAATDPRSRVRIVLTLRADFYDRPLSYPRLAEMVRSHTEIILPLSSQELERAIAGPAERVGLKLEPGLVATIINDIGEQPGTLPLLQYALTELVERREGVTLTLDTYHSSGGISGALARRADELYAALEPTEQAAARQLFLRLITLGEGTEDTRRRVLMAELEAIGDLVLDELINSFARYRLLTFDRDPVTRGPTVEIAHEALIREWTQLREWLTENREELRIQRRLMTVAEEWNAAKREPSFLARGARLTQFEAFAAESSITLNTTEKAYIQSSVAERAAQTDREQLRQKRETDLERRSRSFLRALVGIFMISTVVAIVLTSIAVHQSNIAQRNSELSQSLALASAAQSALTEGSTDQAVALSVAANQIQLPPAFSQRVLYDSAIAPGTIRRLPCANQWCWAMDVSPDQQTVLTGNDIGNIVLSDIVTGQPIHTFTGGHTDSIMAVKFLPDGKRFLSTSTDDQVILWDIPSGQIIRQYKGLTGDMNNVDVSPDGRLAVIATESGLAVLWDIETGQAIRQFVGHDPSRQLQGITFSPDGQTLLTGSEDTTMILWDVKTGELLHRFQGHSNIVFRTRFSPDGKSALSTSFDNTMILWDIATGQVVQRFVGHTNFVFDAVFTPDGKHIVSSSRDQTLGLWDMTTGIRLRTFKGEAGMALSLKLLANGARVLSGYNSGFMRVWQLEDQGISNKFVQTALPAPDQFNDTLNADGNNLSLTKDKKFAAAPGSGADVNQVWLWDIGTGKLVRRFIGHKGNISSVAFSPDQRQLLSASSDNSLILWDVETGNQVRHYDGHNGAVLETAFSPDGKYIASSAEDKSIIIWDTVTATIIHRFDGFTDAVNTVQFSSDGHTLLAGFGTIRSPVGGDNDNSLRLFDMDTMKEIQRFEGHKAPVTVATFSSNNTILSASTDGSVHLWDAATGHEIRRFSSSSTAIWSINLSQNGQYLVAGLQDGTIIIWEFATGDIIRKFQEYDAMVVGITFMADDDTILSAASDGTLHVRQLLLNLDSLVAWIRDNRYMTPLTCEQRQLYQLSSPCGADSTPESK